MKWFIFLKAVNVGGSSKVPMKELVAAIKSTGIETISFYLNSGNLIIESDLPPETILDRVDQSVRKFKADGATLFIKSEQMIRDILAKNPFENRENGDNSKILLYFLSKSVTDFTAIGTHPKIIEKFWGFETALFVYYETGIGNSFLTTNYIDKTCNVFSTGRNLNTLESLLNKKEKSK